jgi:hypothetical protein
MENRGIFYDHLVYFTAIGNILWPFGIFCGHLVYFVAIWYIFPRFGILYQEKSGNPECLAKRGKRGFSTSLVLSEQERCQPVLAPVAPRAAAEPGVRFVHLRFGCDTILKNRQKNVERY